MAEGRKQTHDYSQEVEERLPQILAPVQRDPSHLAVALEGLLSLEKQTRLAADAPSTEKVSIALLDLLVQQNDWTTLSEHVSLLCKRRAQLRQVIQGVVQHALKSLELAPDQTARRQLIVVLRQVSEGKIFVELERARLTKMLSEMEEGEGNVEQACETLQELQIETVGSMDKQEKASFLLEQIRLLLEVKDFVRAEIISNKVNRKVLEEESFQELKLKFYNLMITFHLHSYRYLSICEAYLSILKTPIVQEDIEFAQDTLEQAVIYLLLSPHSDKQQSLMEKLMQEKLLEDVPLAKDALRLFLNHQLIPRPLPQEENWSARPPFSSEQGQRLKEDLHHRVNEHNLRVIARFYSRVSTKRLGELLKLDEDRAEQYISDMVSEKVLVAKIDRSEGVVRFRVGEGSGSSQNQRLNEWSGNISELLGLVENTMHLINKEKMVYNL